MQFETNYEESDSLYTQFCYSKLRRQREREREREMGQERRGNSTYPLKWKEIGANKNERESWGSKPGGAKKQLMYFLSVKYLRFCLVW
jgi:hypothetical protein